MNPYRRILIKSKKTVAITSLIAGGAGILLLVWSGAWMIASGAILLQFSLTLDQLLRIEKTIRALEESVDVAQM